MPLDSFVTFQAPRGRDACQPTTTNARLASTDTRCGRALTLPHDRHALCAAAPQNACCTHRLSSSKAAVSTSQIAVRAVKRRWRTTPLAPHRRPRPRAIATVLQTALRPTASRLRRPQRTAPQTSNTVLGARGLREVIQLIPRPCAPFLPLALACDVSSKRRCGGTYADRFR